LKIRLAFSIAGLILALSSLGACTIPEPATTSPSPIAFQPEWYQVYFSDPGGPSAETKRGGPDQYLAESIRQARLSVEVAAYDLDLWSIRDVLLEAYQRGVAVRMVTDSDNLDEDEIRDLRTVGVPVRGDRREGLMHNKFVIIDSATVWTGSMNLTINSAYRNNDNLIALHSSALARNYSAEFNEMFDEDRFGPGSPANTPDPRLEINGSPVEVYFSPEDGVETEIIRLIRSARRSIRFMLYSFTSDPIAAAILAQSEAGLEVSGIFEAEQAHSNRGTEYDKLLAAGLDVWLDGNPRNMHHKVLIIDERIVLTGSYNFTNNARTLNDENLLVIEQPELAAAYTREFERLYAQRQR
jgi:phosphatidylserine/phosphatidylglycerophosphate/cardiolipin synthase-like enzyme